MVPLRGMEMMASIKILRAAVDFDITVYKPKKERLWLLHQLTVTLEART